MIKFGTPHIKTLLTKVYKLNSSCFFYKNGIAVNSTKRKAQYFAGNVFSLFEMLKLRRILVGLPDGTI